MFNPDFRDKPFLKLLRPKEVMTIGWIPLGGYSLVKKPKSMLSSRPYSIPHGKALWGQAASFLKFSVYTHSCYLLLCIHSSCHWNLFPSLNSFEIPFSSFNNIFLKSFLCVLTVAHAFSFLPPDVLLITFSHSFEPDKRHPSYFPLRIHNHFIQILFSC